MPAMVLLWSDSEPLVLVTHFYLLTLIDLLALAS